MKAWRKISDCERSNHGREVLVFALRRRGFLRRSETHAEAYATKREQTHAEAYGTKRNPEAHAEAYATKRAYATKASYGD